MSMIKLTIACGVAGVMLLGAPEAKADWLFGVHTEAQYWQAENDGGFTQSPENHAWDWDDEGASRLSVNINHFVPFVPNVMIERQWLESSGIADHTSDLSIRGTTFNAPADGGILNSTWDLGHDTYTLYYRLFDNSLLEFYFGLSAKKFNGSMMVSDGTTTFSQDISETVPMGYVRITAGLPLTGWSVRAQGQPVSIGDHDVYDIEASLRYEFFNTLALEGVLAVGYREFSMKLDDASGLYSDFAVSGPFVNFSLHF